MNGNNKLSLAMPDVVVDTASDRTVRVGNGGEVPLRLLLQPYALNFGINGANILLDGQMYSEGFRLMSPSVVLTSGVTALGDRVLTVAPGSEITLHFRMKPVYRNDETVSIKGRYTASFEIQSNDPQAFRTVLELSGTAR